VSTEIAIFSYTFARPSLYILAGTFGGYFPFIYDLIQRQKVPANEKIELNKEFYLIKAVLGPVNTNFVKIRSYGNYHSAI
jgi:hypothetical protein